MICAAFAGLIAKRLWIVRIGSGVFVLTDGMIAMLGAEEQAASKSAAERLISANIRKTTVYLFVAIRMIANSGNAIADVSFPFFVVSK